MIEYQGVLSFLSALLTVGAALVVRREFRYVGIVVLIASLLGGILLFGGYYRVNNRVLSGFEGIEVLIPRELSRIRRDADARALAQSEFGNGGGRYKELSCGVVQKALDPPGNNSVRLMTRYERGTAARLLALNCPRIHASDAATQKLYFDQFARVLAAREQRAVSEIAIFDAAWTGDAALDKGPTIAGCRFSWALKNSSDTFFDVYLAMPRSAAYSYGPCPERKTFVAHMVLSAKRPNQLLLQADYILMWESVWAPLREALKFRNGGKAAPVVWSQDPPAPAPWPAPPPPAKVEPPVNPWPNPQIKVRDWNGGAGAQ
jgi:hypothetical protein